MSKGLFSSVVVGLVFLSVLVSVSVAQEAGHHEDVSWSEEFVVVAGKEKDETKQNENAQTPHHDNTLRVAIVGAGISSASPSLLRHPFQVFPPNSQQRQRQQKWWRDSSGNRSPQGVLLRSRSLSKLIESEEGSERLQRRLCTPQKWGPSSGTRLIER